MGRKDVVLKSFKLFEEPDVKVRTPYYHMSDNEKLSIEKFPFITTNRVEFKIDCIIRDKELELSGIIPKGFCYNFADIPWVVEPLSYDKHSPFVKDASCIHDYLISRKRRLYEEWELKEKGITPEDFRVLTSLVFAYQLQYNGVSYGKAKLMAFFVDLWQTALPSWRTLDKTEIEL